MKNILIISILALTFFACEEKINIDAPEGEAPYVVDAWLYQNAKQQEITISVANSYFDSSQPAGITNAAVKVIDKITNEEYVFSHSQNGKYIWNGANTFGKINHVYELSVKFDNKEISAYTVMTRTAKVDSIKFIKQERDGRIRAEFFAQDSLDAADFFWIKTWKNGKYLGKPAEINVSQDGAFDGGGGNPTNDTIKTNSFIAPIRRGINPDTEDNSEPLYEIGDEIRVQINSLTPISFFFLNQLQNQTDRGGGVEALFAEPISNLGTNLEIKNSDKKVVGLFNISAQEEMSVRITNNLVQDE